MPITITLPNGKALPLSEAATAMDAAKVIGARLAKAALAARVNGQLSDLSATLRDGDKLEILTFERAEGKEVFWHSTSHLLAMAVKELWPHAKLAIGPAIENGFYYDFDLDHSFTPEDLEKIEKKMVEIAGRTVAFQCKEMSRPEAHAFFSGRNEPYKLELMENAEGNLSVYQNQDFADLCRGPHVPDTGYLRHFKLQSLAGAYWRGSEKNKMLQRIYGVSFPEKKQLDEYLQFLTEAEKRDHRNLGKELDLFSTSDMVGPGLVLWHPKGGRLRSLIEDFWRQEHFKNGYELIYSPHIGRGQLWQTSGHLDFYRDNMYAPMEIDEQEYFVKPMNCPFHFMIYKSTQHSYRDLPLRWAELGAVYRYEKSGVLHGLLRVRGFTQDDAHIICRPDQMPEEIRRVLKFCLYMLQSFGFEKFKVYVATRPREKSVGADSLWRDASEALQSAVRQEGLESEIDEGGGAFYGPKIDIKIKDALNREWQCSTIQFDFNEPERFDLNYIAATGEKQRPYVIHRALLGSMERFLGVLIEHYRGAFPLWLAPVQVAVLPVSEKTLAYAGEVHKILMSEGIRPVLDERNQKIGAKIRDAEMQKIPYMLILGEKEEREHTVAVRKHRAGDQGKTEIEEFLNLLKKEMAQRV